MTSNELRMRNWEGMERWLGPPSAHVYWLPFCENGNISVVAYLEHQTAHVLFLALFLFY